MFRLSRDEGRACQEGRESPRPTTAPHRSRNQRRSVLPLGLNAAAFTVSGWGIGAPMSVPVAGSQNRTMRSLLPVRIILPSGWNATAQTLP